jgi:serine/threonine-protein kinase
VVSSPPQLELPALRLDDFEIVQQLASHHGVITYAARRPCGLGAFRQVLLKVTEATLNFGFSSAKQLIDESRLGARLTHPNLLQTIEHGKDAGCFFQVREWVDGIGLRRLLEKVWQLQSFPVPAALYIGSQLCRVLTYLHDSCVPPWAPQGLVHHGVVPSNVIISTCAEVRLGNLFQVRPRGAGIPGPLSPAGEGEAGGTATAYQAPEVLAGEAADPRADLFAAGTLMYEAIVGPEALAGDRGSDWLRVRDDREVLRNLEGDGIPPDLRELLSRAMASSPFERFSTAAAMQHDIDALLHSGYGSSGDSELRALVSRHYQPLPPA